MTEKEKWRRIKESGSKAYTLVQQLDDLERSLTELKKRVLLYEGVMEDAMYLVDFGNAGQRRQRSQFPNDFMGALEYQNEISKQYDWTELLMSINITFNDKYREHRLNIIRNGKQKQP